MSKTRLNNLCALCAGSAFALMSPWTQAQEPPDAAAEEPRPSQEVEVSEDNYRAFMELKDQNAQRRALPFNPNQAPKTGLLSMDELPEDSQKHLRNQLREIILTGEAWTPESAEEYHPYQPSTAAQSDSSLRQQESTAWEELVEEYHAREAELHARTAGNPGQPGNNDENDGAAAPAETAQAPQPSENSPEAETSPFAQNIQPNPGVSESALEFLTSSGQAVNPGSSAPGEAQTKPTGSPQTDTGTTESALQSLSSRPQEASADGSVAGTPQASPEGASSLPPTAEDEGASQSALSHLQGTGNSPQSSNPGEQNTPTQNQARPETPTGQPGAATEQQSTPENALEKLTATGNNSPLNSPEGSTATQNQDNPAQPSNSQATGAQQSALEHLENSIATQNQNNPENTENPAQPSNSQETGTQQSALEHLENLQQHDAEHNRSQSQDTVEQGSDPTLPPQEEEGIEQSALQHLTGGNESGDDPENDDEKIVEDEEETVESGDSP